MKNSRLVFLIAVLMMLSACGNENVTETVTQPAEANVAPVVAEQPAAPAEDAMPEAASPEATETAPVVPAQAPAAKSAPTVMEKAAAVTKEVKTEVAAEIKAVTGGTTAGTSNQDEVMALAKKSGCLACHKIETKLIGPAWIDVSKRYKGDASAQASLVAKVKKGGKGNWSEVTGGAAMPAHSPRISDENIEKMVAFILTL